MRITFKITAELLAQIHEDLSRPHHFAAERVGFIESQVADLNGGGLIILAHRFHPIADGDYINDPRVGAMMGSSAIRKALQIIYSNPGSMFHVHRHDHRGRPWFSRTDLTENSNFVPDFWHVRPKFPHGAIVLSLDSMAGHVWLPQRQERALITDFSVVGVPLQLIRGDQ